MRRIFIATAALLTLSACTPEEAQIVIDDYAARMSADAKPIGSVASDAQCERLALELDGFAPASIAYLSIGGNPPWHYTLDGSLHIEVETRAGYAGESSDHYDWSLTVNNEVVASGESPACY